MKDSFVKGQLFHAFSIEGVKLAEDSFAKMADKPVVNPDIKKQQKELEEQRRKILEQQEEVRDWEGFIVGPYHCKEDPEHFAIAMGPEPFAMGPKSCRISPEQWALVTAR